MSTWSLATAESEVRPHVLEPFLLLTEDCDSDASESERLLQEMHERGRAEGRREAESALRTAAEALSASVHTLNSQVRSAREEMERDIVKLSLAVARRVVMHELATRPETILQIAHALLEEAEDRNVSAMRLNPADLERLRQSGASAALEQAGIALHGSEEIRAGGCVLETDFGRLDARVETRLDEIAGALLGGDHSRDETKEDGGDAQ
jgi:flagellar biosynthesis/type III secretory pathway protein FliH